ncbi:MAG: hypothetical protein V3V52_02260, partial [Candidatus Adiutricales bacterium]
RIPGLYRGAENAPQLARDLHAVAAIRTKVGNFSGVYPEFSISKKKYSKLNKNWVQSILFLHPFYPCSIHKISPFTRLTPYFSCSILLPDRPRRWVKKWHWKLDLNVTSILLGPFDGYC